uniref:Tn3 family transposase n=2 Tax=Thiolapillus sp. TaxID=2017437 RepID=UPI003AF613B8
LRIGTKNNRNYSKRKSMIYRDLTASSLSLVSNAILYWNTSRISNIVDELRKQGETVDDDLLAHISLLPYKHVLPNGTYFIEQEDVK